MGLLKESAYRYIRAVVVSVACSFVQTFENFLRVRPISLMLFMAFNLLLGLSSSSSEFFA